MKAISMVDTYFPIDCGDASITVRDVLRDKVRVAGVNYSLCSRQTSLRDWPQESGDGNIMEGLLKKAR